MILCSRELLGGNGQWKGVDGLSSGRRFQLCNVVFSTATAWMGESRSQASESGYHMEFDRKHRELQHTEEASKCSHVGAT